MKKHIRIKLKSFDFRIMEKLILKFINIAYSTKAKIYGPIPLPIIKEKFTILISPHVDKDARDQYEICTYKRLLGIITSNFKTIEKLMKIKLISGIFIKINII
ncbi:30S ribosomal protein S10 [Enterobacteriaceae bacterium ET-AT1-13]|nr:30S ribosomal protein S10 [Enterobacteriaceae bacterium ET-AT1-13]WGS66328.1 30S ribosomal protein S10 [Enterobacteriaceae bacterium Cmel17]WMC17351.1 MAG: 30S ribosomal protein S10 [Enterobacteriaceae bacterium Cmel21]WMC17557.1 MAG: 30S ribosomal protein S10 [Enterobacteriaceae bacterium PSmelAO3-2]WMC17762.1 MAG: 30S ribosomal protein S10 [Enterobacteriaceae bacterium PSmelAO3-1]WMC17965.1 MAG: 30S ribosomal protein S10 [Enterobacteriaceae bacterium PSmelAO1]